MQMFVVDLEFVPRIPGGSTSTLLENPTLWSFCKHVSFWIATILKELKGLSKDHKKESSRRKKIRNKHS
jgi:hypothetical protein